MVLLDPFVGFALCFVSFSKLAVLTSHFLLQRLAHAQILVFGHRSAVIAQALLMTFDGLCVGFERLAVQAKHLLQLR